MSTAVVTWRVHTWDDMGALTNAYEIQDTAKGAAAVKKFLQGKWKHVSVVRVPRALMRRKR